MTPWCRWLRALKKQFSNDGVNICIYKYTCMCIWVFVCVMWLPLTPPPLTPVSHSCWEDRGRVVPSASTGLLWPCCCPCWGREGVCLHSFLLNCTRRASAWGQRKSQVHWCHMVFFLPSDFSFLPPPWSCLNYFLFFFFSSLAEPLSSFAMTASRRESVALVGFRNLLRARFLSHCFPLSQSGGGVFLAAAPTAGLLRRCLRRTRPPDKHSALSAYEFCTLASSRHFSKP